MDIIEQLKKELRAKIEALKNDRVTYLENIKKGKYEGKQLRRTTWQIYIYEGKICDYSYVLAALGEKEIIKELEDAGLKRSGDYYALFDDFEKRFMKFYKLK